MTTAQPTQACDHCLAPDRIDAPIEIAGRYGRMFDLPSLEADEELLMQIGAAGCIEELGLARALAAQPVDEAVVRADERDLHLAHEDVNVVAGVPDERKPLVVARDVAVVLEQLGRV